MTTPNPNSASEQGPKIEKKGRMRPTTEAAVIKILKRVEGGFPPAYEQIAAEFGLSAGALRVAVAKVRSGKIALSSEFNLQDLAIRRELEEKNRMHLLEEIEQMMWDTAGVIVERARAFQTKGKIYAWQDMGLPKVMAEIRAIRSMKFSGQKQMLELMREANREKEVKAAVAEVPAEVVRQHADGADESVRAQRALAALHQSAQEGEVSTPAADDTEIPRSTPEGVQGQERRPD